MKALELFPLKDIGVFWCKRKRSSSGKFFDFQLGCQTWLYCNIPNIIATRNFDLDLSQWASRKQYFWLVTNQNVSVCDLSEWRSKLRHIHMTTQLLTKVLSVNEDDEDAFQEDEVEEEAVRLNNEWLALFHSDTDDEYFEGF